MGGIDCPDHPGILERKWWASHVPKQVSQFIHVLSTTTDSDDGVAIEGITMASDFCDRIDHPVVDEGLNDLIPLEQSLGHSSLTYTITGPGA